MKKKNIRSKARKIAPKKKTIQKSARKITRKIVKKTPPKPLILKETIIQGKIPAELSLLEQFFGGTIKLKLWKVFLLNTTRELTLKDLGRLTKTKTQLLIPAIRDMMKQGIIEGNRKAFAKDGAHKEIAVFYKATKDFPLMPEITQLILKAIPRSPEKVLSEMVSLNRLKTVLLSGFFTSKLGLSTPTFSATQSPVDMLLIFEKIPVNVTEIVAELEHKLGRDLRYAALDETDFKYRHSIGDKLIRDVLDFDHVVAMDKMSFFR